MKKVLDGDKVEKQIIMGESLTDMKRDEILYLLVDCCTLSPTELAGILGGKAWVVEKLKKKLKEYKHKEFKQPITDPKEAYELGWQASMKNISIVTKCLESQAPASDPAKRAKEDRRKAEAWDTLSGTRAETKDKEPFVKEMKEIMQTIWDLQDELLTEEEKR